MPDTTKKCSSCGEKLINKRSHAKTCSNTCRWRMWQAKQLALIPVKLMFDFASYELIKSRSAATGVSINNYLYAQAVAGLKQ